MLLFLCILLAFAGLLLLSMLREAFLNQVIEHHLFYESFPESYGKAAIFFISDIHKRRISSKIIDKVKGKADMVIIGGDLTEKGVPFAKVKKNLQRLKDVAPVYFVWGNNDYETDIQRLEAIFKQLDIQVLNNKSVTFASEQGEKWYLLGVDDLNQDLDRLDLALLNTEKESFKILISHYPKIIEKIEHEYNISLVLSGHTHGGQIHIMGYSPYEKGCVKEINGITLLISNGYGTTALPFRLGAPAECHLVVIRNSPKQV